MKIEKIKRVPIEKFAAEHNLTLVACERKPRDFCREPWREDFRWYVSFHGAEITDGYVLSNPFGEGRTPAAARKNYAKQISGRRLVIGAWTADRKEITLPELT